MPVETKAMTVEVSGVTDVVVTPTVQEEGEEGLYIREIRVFGVPPVGSQTAPQEFVLRLKGTLPENLAITAPSNDF